MGLSTRACAHSARRACSQRKKSVLAEAETGSHCFVRPLWRPARRANSQALAPHATAGQAIASKPSQAACALTRVWPAPQFGPPCPMCLARNVACAGSAGRLSVPLAGYNRYNDTLQLCRVEDRVPARLSSRRFTFFKAQITGRTLDLLRELEQQFKVLAGLPAARSRIARGQESEGPRRAPNGRLGALKQPENTNAPHQRDTNRPFCHSL